MARILYQALQSRGALQKGGAQVDVYSILLYRAQKTEVRTISYVPESCDCFLRPYCGGAFCQPKLPTLPVFLSFSALSSLG